MANVPELVTPSHELLTPAERQLLREYHDVCARLRKAGLARSGNISGDIGEWLIVQLYGLELVKSSRNKGFEGYIELEGTPRRAQVKMHNSTEGTNHNVGNPKLYDVLFVVLGPASKLRDPRITECGRDSFHVYVFEPWEVEKMTPCAGGTYTCATAALHAQAPHSIVPF
jgi:hypothetical protein